MLCQTKGAAKHMIAQQIFSEVIKSYESALDDSCRAENGIFYTDIVLAEKIIANLNIPKDATILDPCCGVGSFLYAANKKQHFNIYGADCDDKAVSICSQYIPNAKLITIDSIGSPANLLLEKLNFSEKFDYVIGNPPYAPLSSKVEINSDDIIFKNKVNAYGKNLFVAALIRALELVKENGIVSYIIPKNFLHVSTYSRFRKEILKNKTIISIVDLGICFKRVRGEQIVLTLKNCPPADSFIKFQKYENGNFVSLPVEIPQSFYNDEIILFTCENDYIIYKKLTSAFQTLNDHKGGYVGRGKSKSENAISGKDIRKFGYKNIKLPTEGSQIFIQNIYSAESGIIAAFGGNLEASETVTVFTDGDKKMCRYILGILHSRLANFFLYKYCYNNSRLTMHTDSKYLKKIPLPTFDQNTFNEILMIVSSIETEEYMSRPWFDYLEKLNIAVYKAYGIDAELSKYIDSEMRTIQSKRWLSND